MIQNIAIYPGSFDPITKGHLDIISRGAKLFDQLYVVVSENIAKQTLFTVDERVNFIQGALASTSNVEVVICKNKLTVDVAHELGASVILRGLRGLHDFEPEFELAMINADLDVAIETLFLPTRQENMFLSSSSVKEIAKFSGDVSPFVPNLVAKALSAKFGDENLE